MRWKSELQLISPGAPQTQVITSIDRGVEEERKYLFPLKIHKSKPFSFTSDSEKPKKREEKPNPEG